MKKKLFCALNVQQRKHLASILCCATILTAVPASVAYAEPLATEARPTYSLLQVINIINEEFTGTVQSIELKHDETGKASYVANILEGGQQLRVLFRENGIEIVPIRTENSTVQPNLAPIANVTPTVVPASTEQAIGTNSNLLTRSTSQITQPATSSRITDSTARQIALAHTGGGTVVKSELDRENGVLVYEVEIVNGNSIFEIYVGANDSQIYKNKSKAISIVSNNANAQNASISVERAKSIAIERAGGGIVTECKLKINKGTLIL